MGEKNEMLVKTSEARNMVLGLADLSELPLEKRVEILQRMSEAQASEAIDNYLEKEIVVVGITPYVRGSIDPETGEILQYSYVTFHLAGGESMKTASSQAFPHLMEIATVLGYNMATGQLPHPYKLFIKPQKATTGFIYRFIFKGLAGKESK